MRTSVIGAGYVGMALAAGLAKLGNRVVLMDIDEGKIDRINRKESPIHERGMTELLNEVEIETSTSLPHAVGNSDISFVCVGTTGGGPECTTELRAVRQVAEELGRELRGYHLVVVKSTVPPGTTEQVIIPLLENGGKKAGRDFGICVNPEFLREGSALEDFLHPDRIIIGALDQRSGELLSQLFRPFSCPLVRVSLRTAEMIKYASNAFLAAKISFINEIGNICRLLGIDVQEVARGMGYDPRIGGLFLQAGIGFGGSCLPKDLRALIGTARELSYHPHLLEAVLATNEEQPLRMVKLLKGHLPRLQGRKIGVLGLAFKPDTDDVRESRAIGVIAALLEEGATVAAYDPKARDNFRKLFPQIEYVTPEEVLQADAVLILTEWEEFRHLDFSGKLVIDGRRLPGADRAGTYEGICW